MKNAILMMNLGGPDSIPAIKPFLFNLFNDKNIINILQPFRYLLAKYISTKRFSTAKEIYSHLGDKSPILDETEKQAQALEKILGKEYKTFIAMRYWHPFMEDTLKEIDEYKPDKVIVLPLYPQYSTTTTLSSFKTCIDQIKYPKKIVCCYHKQSDFIEAHYELIMKSYSKAKQFGNPRVLFSAHGLPVSIIKKGDPYEWQINNTAKLIIERMNVEDLDWKVCYQSKVGRAQWLSPSTEAEIIIANTNNIPLVVVPIAFVSEHSETLVELDIEYRESARDTPYFRVPALSINNNFIKSLSKLCSTDACNDICPAQHKMCWKRLLNS